MVGPKCPEADIEAATTVVRAELAAEFLTDHCKDIRLRVAIEDATI